MKPLKDSFFREIDYLRFSITDRCNLRCIYCMPPEGVLPFRHQDILTYEEIVRIITIAAGLGIKKIRLTGGEPLSRKNISFLIASIKNIEGITDLSMTTNGMLLEKFAQDIAAAGLDRINISIDSLKPERYRHITGHGSLDTVLKGLAAAEQAGLNPVKINMVPIRGLNDDEIADFARLTIDSELQVRFIEFMPSASIDSWSPDKYIATKEIKAVIEHIAPLSPVRLRKNGPSKYFRLKGAKGVIGFISALTHHFCGGCNRIRITADGKIRSCLFSESEIDLRSALRMGMPDTELERLLKLSVAVKPRGHAITNAGKERNVRLTSETGNVEAHAFASLKKRPMSRIGG